MNLTGISDTDRALIKQLREAISSELSLVPAYDDDYSLLRWLVGWDRKLDDVIPKIKFSLQAISALDLDKQDFSSIEKVSAYCDSISEPLQYIPGSLLGYDKEHNVISLQTIGRLDLQGLMPCMRNSDLYILRIAESEGVMNLIRQNEKILGRQLGTTVIFDLEGVGMDMLWTSRVVTKVVTTMLAQLQEMFPDVIRKLFIINAPTFFHVIWKIVSPCLAKQTQEKIRILGDDWKEKLKECIDEDVLYENWGGTRQADTPFGHIRMGGKVPKELRYDPSNDVPADQLKTLKISAGSVQTVPVTVEAFNPNRQLSWWWRVESGDVDFSIVRSCDSADVDGEDVVVRPRFRLQTMYVPEDGKVSCALPGTYSLVFDNRHSMFYSKTVKYQIKVLND